MTTIVTTYHMVDRHRPMVYVGRPSPLGNPFVLGPDGDRPGVIAKYKRWLRSKVEARDKTVLDELNKIRAIRIDKGEVQLICYCYPQECHADVIARVIENSLIERN